MWTGTCPSPLILPLLKLLSSKLLTYMMPQIATEWNENAAPHTRIVYGGAQLGDLVDSDLGPYFHITQHNTLEKLEDYLGNQSILSVPEIILMEVDEYGECFDVVERLKANFLFNGVIIVLLSLSNDREFRQNAVD